MSDAARNIIEENIKYYRGLLKTETNTSKRQTIAKLLAEEEAKLDFWLQEAMTSEV
jgi:hypothetical protein